MKLAVTYEDGVIFQHFGHTPFFKLYETQAGKVISSTVVTTEGSGHGALAGLLREHGAQVLICGGIGQGAKDALVQAGILLVAGAAGDADAAVDGFLKGDLQNDPSAGCSHHHEGEHTCGEHSCGGHSCGNH
ncbi:MAG: dinitrogenase iron-molybdenum cofactor biosynthesis protein [Anaerotruncus sp.]|nr:dinitrogenase iron-molybdenum cofactor biosynthesis protein [Anaerotruncus sp.]